MLVSMEKPNPRVWGAKLTKQGVRDLNHYGPTRGKGAPAAAPEANGGTAKPSSSAEPNGSGLAAEPSEIFTSPSEPSRPTIEGDGSLGPQNALTA